MCSRAGREGVGERKREGERDEGMQGRKERERDTHIYTQTDRWSIEVWSIEIWSIEVWSIEIWSIEV